MTFKKNDGACGEHYVIILKRTLKEVIHYDKGASRKGRPQRDTTKPGAHRDDHRGMNGER